MAFIFDDPLVLFDDLVVLFNGEPLPVYGAARTLISNEQTDRRSAGEQVGSRPVAAQTQRTTGLAGNRAAQRSTACR